MIVYKSSLFIIAKNVFYGIFGGGFAGLVASWFSLDLIFSIPIGVLVGSFIIYSALIGDNIRVEIDGDTLSFYRLGKLKHQFQISRVGLHAKIRTSDGDSDCNLTITDEEGKSTNIDCSMLGKSRFYKLLDSLKVFDEPVELPTRKDGN